MIPSSLRVGTDVHSRHEQWISVYGIQQGLPSLDRASGAATRAAHLTRREQQVVKLFLEGYENIDIARHLGIAHRTVKACFNRLYLRFGITSGIKRVKLATLLYRRQLCLEANVTESESQASERAASLSLLPRDSRTKRLLTRSEQPNTSLRTTSESSMTSLDSGIESNSLSGMKPEDSNTSPEHDEPESWEHSILGLGTASAHHN